MKYILNKSLYLIYNKEIKRIKIGITNDINSRLSSLKCSSGCELELIYCSEKLKNSEYVEKKLHDFYKDSRHIGEWFNCVDVNPIIEFSKIYIEKYGVKEIEKKDDIKDEFYIKSSNTKILNNINFAIYERVSENLYIDKNKKQYNIIFKNGFWEISEKL